MTSIINPHRSSSSLWSNCRPDIQRRINALLNYQARIFSITCRNFIDNLQDLQYTYSSQFEQIFERRIDEIINGSYESKELENENQLNLVESKSSSNNRFTIISGLTVSKKCRFIWLSHSITVMNFV